MQAIQQVFDAAAAAGDEAELEARFSAGPEVYQRVIAVLDGGVSWDSHTVREVHDRLYARDVRVRHTGALVETHQKQVLAQLDLSAAEVVAVAGLTIHPAPPTGVRFQASREKRLDAAPQGQQPHTIRQKRTHSYVYKGAWRFDVSLVNDERVELELEAVGQPGPDGVRSMCMKVCDLLQMAFP